MQEIFHLIFSLGIFWVEERRNAATPLNIVLSPGNNDTTRFRTWSPIATGIYLDRDEKFPNLRRLLARFTLLFRFQAFRYSNPADFPCTNIHE